MADPINLLDTPRVPELGPGPRPDVRSVSEIKQALKNTELRSPYSELVQALVLLWHDHLEPAHRLAQEVENADGSYVHGMMHRREPDYRNAKYWFRRVGQHPTFDPLAGAVAGTLPKAANLIVQGRWDPFAFVDACQAAERDPELASLLREVQAVEFRLLLQYLCAAATTS